MGYTTDFDLQVKTWKNRDLPTDFVEDMISQLRDACAGAKDALSATGRCSGNETCWYQHEPDLRAFSKRHPAFLFILHGQGEGRTPEPDIWNKYFLDGKMQVETAKLQISPFDASKLV